MNKIAIAGSVLVDRIKEIDAYPSQGELTQIHSIVSAIGGCVPNVAIDLKKIDPSLPVYAIGKTGRDDDRNLLWNTMSAHGVDCRFLSDCDDLTSFTDVMSITGGQRTFFTYAGACARFCYDDIDWDALEQEGITMLHLGYFLLLQKIDEGDGLRILKEAKRRGITTSIDLVSESSDRYSIVLPCLPYVDNLIINEIEAGKLTGLSPVYENLGVIAHKLLELGVRQRVILHMNELSLCADCNGMTVLPSLDLPKGYIKGTTGAGDAFCAGSLYQIAMGATPAQILEFASCAAVASLAAPDAISAMCDEKQIRTLCAPFARKQIDVSFIQ